MRISDWSSDVCSSDLPAQYHAGYARIILECLDVAPQVREHRDRQSVQLVGTVKGQQRPTTTILTSHQIRHAKHPILWVAVASAFTGRRSEERSGGKEGVRTWSSRGLPLN